MDRGTILRGIGYGVAALLLNTLIALLWVFFYSFAIAPGHEGGFYQAYAQRVAPISALVAGVPLLLGAGYLTARSGGSLVAAAIPAAAYLLLDLLLMGLGRLWMPAALLALSCFTKIVAALAGGWLAPRALRLQ